MSLFNSILTRRLCLLGLMLVFSGCGSHPDAPVTDLSPLDRRNTQYTVQDGDTLHAIAFGNGLNVNDLASWNHIVDTAKLNVGQQVRLTRPLNFKRKVKSQRVDSQKSMAKRSGGSQPSTSQLTT